MSELDYLNKNNIYINQEENTFISKIRRNAMKYGNNIQAYDEYINFIAYLIRCLSIPRDTLCASVVLNMLTKKGIFSDGYKLDIDGNPCDDIFGFLGINVIKGHAVCRHLSNFQSDVLKKLDLMCEPFYCYLSKNNINNADKMDVNHAINLIEYKNNLYGYDPLNNVLFKFVGEKKLEEMYTKRAHYLYYKPYLHMMLSEMNANNVNNMLEIFDIIKDKEVITFDHYNDILNYANNIVDENNNLFNDFHQSSKKYIKKITSGLK